MFLLNTTQINEAAVRSISQKEGNAFLVKFFNERDNAPVEYAELAQAVKKELQANSNQTSGLIHRAHSAENGSVLVKNGKEYSLNMKVCKQSSLIDNVKSQILDFKKSLDKTISINDVSSETEFKQIKDILNKLEELGK